MKDSFKLVLLSIWLGACTAPELRQQSSEAENGTDYDSTLVQKWGADEYGMKSYVFVLLTSGSDTTLSIDERSSIGKAHLEHIQSLSEDGKLVLAGPFYEANNYRGIFIFNTSDIEEARAWVTSDPAVQAEILHAELLPWYGSAALQEIPQLHRKVEKVNPAQ